MGQENETRFSHISVGRSADDGWPRQEDEEVVAIGAVDLVSASASTSASPSAPEAVGDVAEPVRVRTTDTEDEFVPASDESGFDTPMSTAQKLVIALCFVGLVVTIVFLVWFWTTQRSL
jgi:hypothetical protein